MSVETGTPTTPAAPAAAVVGVVPTIPTGTPTPGVDPNAPQHPATVVIPYDQLQAFTSAQARLAQMEADQRDRDERARAELARTQISKGEIETALNQLREDSRKQVETARAEKQSIEDRAKRHAADAALAIHLSEHPLLPGAAEQLSMIFRPQLAVAPNGDSFGVTGPNYAPVKDFLAAKLATPEFAHFLRATNPGGGTAGGAASGSSAAPTNPANPAAPPQPKNFGDAIIMQMQAMEKEKPSDPRLNINAAMGLNPRSVAATNRAQTA